MNKDQDEALMLTNPRILSGAYFGLLAIIVTIIIDAILYALGIEEIIPFFKAVILAFVIAAIFGAMFGESIVHSTRPYKKHAFWWAFLMVILAIPVYSLGLLYFIHQHHTSLFEHASVNNWLIIYLLIIFYSLTIAGVWIALFAGLAAIFLRGYVVYFLLHSLYKTRKNPQEQTIKPRNKGGNG